jgi:flavin-dependent thymidylate synthase
MSPHELLCKRCDVFVGFGGAGVAKQPEGKTEEWLRTHCWVCGRSAGEIAREQEPELMAAVEDVERFEFKEVAEASRSVPSTELSRYVDPAMFEAEDVTERMPRVYLLSATPDPLGSVAAMSMMYEGKVVRDLADVTDDQRVHYWGESFKTHLKAPWESIDLHFLVEGVTRAFTHQMVRQRTAVFAQESMRFAVKHKIAARPGPIVGNDPLTDAKWKDAIEDIWEKYNELIALGVPAEEARGLLPHDTLTRLHYKTNLRNLADHLGNRLCTQAQFEWRLVAAQLRQALREYKGPALAPTPGASIYVGNAWQFERLAESPIFQPVCFTMGKCPFKADFDRGCTIRERVDAGRFDEIKPEEWLADPTAGWVR